jgi:hypothetical protein
MLKLVFWRYRIPLREAKLCSVTLHVPTSRSVDQTLFAKKGGGGDRLHGVGEYCLVTPLWLWVGCVNKSRDLMDEPELDFCN